MTFVDKSYTAEGTFLSVHDGKTTRHHALALHALRSHTEDSCAIVESVDRRKSLEKIK